MNALARGTTAAAVLLALLVHGDADAQTPKGGAWAGWGFQATPAGLDSSWPIRIRFRGAAEADIAYPSLGCGGVLRLRRAGAELSEFRETLTENRGDCVDGGTVALRPVPGALLFTWLGTDTSYPDGVATGVLWREGGPVADRELGNREPGTRGPGNRGTGG